VARPRDAVGGFGPVAEVTPAGDAAFERLGVVTDPPLTEALRRFKSLAETGDIQTLDPNTSARGEGDLV